MGKGRVNGLTHPLSASGASGGLGSVINGLTPLVLLPSPLRHLRRALEVHKRDSPLLRLLPDRSAGLEPRIMLPIHEKPTVK